MKKQLFLFAFMITILAACSKTKVDNTSSGAGNTGATGAVSEPGYGPSNTSFSAPAWKLPSGVEMDDSIHDYSYCWAFPPFTNVQPKDWKGVPVGFTFCMTIKNKNNNLPFIIHFPPELILASSSFKHQNVLIIELGDVELQPGESRTIVAQGFCINKGREIPQTFKDGTSDFLSYTFGPSNIPAALKEVTDIVESKHITMNDILKPDGTIDNTKIEKYVPIQTAIWEVTDGQGLTNETRNKLQHL